MADFIEPFGLVLHKNAGSDTFLPSYVQLPTGVNTILVNVPGTKAVTFSISSWNTWVSMLEHITIPAGTKNWVHTIGVRAGETRFITMISNPGLADEMRANITVTTIPLKSSGGGVRFYSLPLLPSGGGRCERVSRAVRYPHGQRPGHFRTALALSCKWARVRHPGMGSGSLTEPDSDMEMHSGENRVYLPGKYYGGATTHLYIPSNNISASHSNAHRAKAWGSNQSITVNRGVRATGRASGYSSAHTIQRVNPARWWQHD